MKSNLLFKQIKTAANVQQDTHITAAFCYSWGGLDNE